MDSPTSLQAGLNSFKCRVKSLGDLFVSEFDDERFVMSDACRKTFEKIKKFIQKLHGNSDEIKSKKRTRREIT